MTRSSALKAFGGALVLSAAAVILLLNTSAPEQNSVSLSASKDIKITKDFLAHLKQYGLSYKTKAEFDKRLNLYLKAETEIKALQ